MTDSLQTIGYSAFAGSGIEKLKTGASVTSIGDFAFYSCHGLTRAEISDPVTTLGKMTFAYSALKNVIVGNGVHKIPEEFCLGCSGLTSVMLGNAVDTLDAQCFKYCEYLDTIMCMAKVPPVMNGAEDSFFEPLVFQNATLYVPVGSLEAYKTAKVWKKFQNIVAKNFDIPGDVNGDGEINIGDTNSVIDVIINGGGAGTGGHSRIPACDVNGDGEVNIADVNAIIELIIGN